MLGEVKFITLAEIPDYCALCDGSERYIVDYPAYAAIMHDNYKVGLTRFKLPNLIDRFPRGDTDPANEGGSDTHTLTVAELPAHHHADNTVGLIASDVLGELPGLTNQNPVTVTTGDTGGGNAFTITNPYETIIPVIVLRDPETPAPDENQVIWDTFTDVNGTLMTAHMPDVDKEAVGWQNTGFCGLTAPNEVQIQNNKAVLTTVTGGAVIEAGNSDVEMQVLWTASNAGADNRMNFYFRYVDVDNILMLFFRPTTNEVMIRSLAPGCSVTVLSTAAFTTNPGQTYAIKIVAVGNQIDCWIDNVLIVSATTALYQSATKFGFHCGNGLAGQVLENFEVRKA